MSKTFHNFKRRNHKNLLLSKNIEHEGANYIDTWRTRFLGIVLEISVMDIRYLCLTSLRNKKEGRKSEIGEYQELRSEIKLKQNHREI